MSFELLLKRYFGSLLLVPIASIAYFQAVGTVQLIGRAITEPPSPAAFALLGRRLPVVERRRVRSAKGILARNVFDSSTGPIDLDARASETLAGAPMSVVEDPLAAPSCDNFVAFIITESTDPLWSLTALRGPDESVPKLRRVGDMVAGKQVAYVGFNPREQNPAVWLQGGSGICQIQMFSRTVAVAAMNSAGPKPTSSSSLKSVGGVTTRGAASVAPEIASRIQKISDHEFHVDRAALDRILADPKALMTAGRMVPEAGPDGRVLGVKLSGIRQDTLLGTLGLQNGDRLETVNGFELASPEKALEAYARLRMADGVRLQLSRQGNPIAIDYAIR